MQRHRRNDASTSGYCAPGPPEGGPSAVKRRIFAWPGFSRIVPSTKWLLHQPPSLRRDQSTTTQPRSSFSHLRRACKVKCEHSKRPVFLAALSRALYGRV